MSTLSDIRARSTWRDILEGQPQHLGLIILLAAGACTLMQPSPNDTRLLGLEGRQWAMVSVWLAIIHQVIVAFVFRMQLHRNLLSRIRGENDIKTWTLLFIPLLVARPITVIMTGWADDVPIGLPRSVEWVVGAVLVAVAIITMHSVIKHFTIRRAVGGDHFRDEIAAMPMVREGMFKYTDNAMYGVVFLGLWGIALLFDSWNALVLALFQKTYIWVHMYCTEKPDMEWIYGNR
ncbi:Phospholipid methyltransferase [Shimia gijangensis]|uniref:Phospholipid methyltransferase n=1 Tax=Shimia gijangensis TaxID=1470563 RepID=A0A1M6NJG6_9RHOB|nr:methyltransferase [Shimia gijangensis]SHJ95809.1 Phospholipid methyltransferase [Shimia gijangensis]